MKMPIHLHKSRIWQHVNISTRRMEWKAFAETIRNSKGRNLKVCIRDGKYPVVSRKAMTLIVERFIHLNKHRYIPDEYDCDDFAKSFWAFTSDNFRISSGFVTDVSGGHAYNCAIVHDHGKLDVVWIEPQARRIKDAIMDEHPRMRQYKGNAGEIDF